MSHQIRTQLDTWFKLSLAQGSDLSDDQKVLIKAGTTVEIAAYRAEGNHLKITLGKDAEGNQIFLKGRNTWYVYGGAAEILNNGQVVDLSPSTGAQATASASGGLPIAGIEIIKEYEGYATALPDGRAAAYADPIHGWGVPTIGYGTTAYPDGSKVKQGDVITRNEAEKYLIDHINHSTRAAMERIPTWGQMNDNQRSALYSFAYNLGAGFYGGPDFQSITRVCDSPQRWQDKAWVEAQFVKYRNPGSAAEAGLRRRREAEAALFCA
jgi:GH24 family phage-related lysozyme (muramidase)